MAPYTGMSSSWSLSSSTKGYRDKKDDVLLQLTDRLREREDELRQVCRERDRLEDQLQLRGNLPLHLDVAYEELLAHCKKREEEFEKAIEQHERESRALENKCHALEEKLEKQHRMLDDYEQEVTDERVEMKNEIMKSHKQLDIAAGEIAKKDKQISSLENMVERLKVENDRLLDIEDDDKKLISHMSKQIQDIKELEMLNFQLEERFERQEMLLRKKDEALDNYTKFHQDELKNMELRLHEVIDLQHKDLQERDEEIIMLKRDIEKYEDILNEADHVTHEQRRELRAREERIDQLYFAIERSQNSGLLSHLDKMCR
jgi:chromosome segregation ATPase